MIDMTTKKEGQLGKKELSMLMETISMRDALTHR